MKGSDPKEKKFEWNEDVYHRLKEISGGRDEAERNVNPDVPNLGPEIKI